ARRSHHRGGGDLRCADDVAAVSGKDAAPCGGGAHARSGGYRARPGSLYRARRSRGPPGRPGLSRRQAGVSSLGDGGPERSGLRVLLVDDDPTMARLVQQILVAHGFSAPTHVTTGRDALASADAVDVMLLDQQLPDVAGLDLLETLRARAQPPAVILVTAHGNESLAARALRQGADDYLAKDQAFADLLPQVLERVRRNRAVHAALAAAERELLRTERLTAIGELT